MLSPLPPFHFRRATIADMPQVLVIEASVQQTPWSLGVLEMTLYTDEQFWLVELDHPKDEFPLIGFMVASVFPPQADLTNIGVHPAYQGRGLGGQMLNHLWAQLANKGVGELTLEVRVSNDRAIGLYQKLGFVVTGKRKNYYHCVDDNGHIIGTEDALTMSRYAATLDGGKFAPIG